MVSFTFVQKETVNFHYHTTTTTLSLNENGEYTKQQRWFQAVLPGVHVYQTCYQEDQSVVEVC
jgi:hypothetical protein